MGAEELVKTLHPLEIKVLNSIADTPLTIEEISSQLSLNEAQTRSGINWLEAKKLIDKSGKNTFTKFTLTEKGKEYSQKELPELAIYKYISANPDCQINHLMSNLEVDKKDIGSAFGFLKKNNALRQNDKGILAIAEGFDLPYYTQLSSLLEKISQLGQILSRDMDEADSQTLTKALDIQLHKHFFKTKESDIFTYMLTPAGRELKVVLEKEKVSGDEISQITPEILKEKSWKEKSFRQYNIQLPGPHILIGKKHPYREFLDFLKYKFVGLGFSEMRGSLVETEFWNMDALFMPQTHPARDIHDGYYIKDPTSAQQIEEPFFSRVANTHENGGNTDSRGWGYSFSKEKAKQLILRSQGTVLSARTLAKKPHIPGRYFSIARCFRYDKVDATHLADFFQVEGIVLSQDANISTLMGLLELFAKKIALAKDIKFTPGYFPFTEPSVEVHIKHPKLGWYELGGSGIFRPEVTEPLGITAPVLAWGLGVDRMAMMALRFNDNRDLFSRDLDLIRTARLEMEHA